MNEENRVNLSVRGIVALIEDCHASVISIHGWRRKPLFRPLQGKIKSFGM